jgi:hypothetical protein
MLEVIGAITGVLSLALAVLLEWDNIKARLAGFRRQPEQAVAGEPPPASEAAAAPVPKVQPAVVKEAASKPRTVIRLLSEILKALLSVLLGGFVVSVGMVPVLQELVGLSVDSSAYQLLITLSLIAGVVLGIVYLRKRSWGFVLAFGGFGLILVSVLVTLSGV